MIIRQLAARSAGIRSPTGAFLPSGWQSSRNAASASAAQELPHTRDDPVHCDRTTYVEPPRIKMPAGGDRPALDSSGPAAASSSSSASSSQPGTFHETSATLAQSSISSDTCSGQVPSVTGKQVTRTSSATRPPNPRTPSRSRPRRKLKGSRSPTPPSTSGMSPEELEKEKLKKQEAQRAERFIQTALSVPVAEPKLYVRQLLERLESDRSLLNPNSVLALETYALRLNEQKAANRVRNLALAERMSLPPRPIVRDYRIDVETNEWMMKRYPPLEMLPEGTVSVSAFLRHQHYLLIQSEGYSLKSAVETLRSMKASGAAQLAALNMALSYAPEPHSLLAEAKELGMTYFPRRTVHASVITLLKCRTSVGDVESLLEQFTVMPSPESFCLVALHALEHSDRELAVYAWEEGKKALAHERLKAQVPQNWGPDPFRQPPNKSFKTLFRHLGRHLSRWERTMHKMKDRGWATRIKFEGELPEGLPLLAARWAWVPESETSDSKARPQRPHPTRPTGKTTETAVGQVAAEQKTTDK